MPGLNERTRNFLSRRTDYEQKMLESYMKGERFNNSPLPDYGSIFSNKNNVYRDIPQMLQDPIIASCVAVVMETAFQPTEDDAIVRVSSPYKKVAEELEDFHREYEMDSAILTTGFNTLVYGNVPIKIEYDNQMQFVRYQFIPSFTDVTPIIISNRVLGFMYQGEFYDPFEFSYAQHLYYRDLGGVSKRVSTNAKITGKPDDAIENEFVIAPSYLSAAVRPWRNVKIIEDALLLQRMDVSNYMRIIGVHVGDNVFSKNAVKLMNFYRQVFKKVRRASYDGDGMSSSSFGNEFEVILPTTSSQSVDVKDIGGQTEVRAIRDLDIQYKKLFSSLRILPSYIGFTEESGNSLGGESDGTMQRKDERFGRLAKALRLSVTKAIKKIDVCYLRSKGYDVSEDDFTFTYLATSTVEDAERLATLKKYIGTIAEMTQALEGAGVKFNANYLVKEVFAQAMSATSIDVEKLFDTSDQKPLAPPAPVNSSLLTVDRDKSLLEFKRLGLLTDADMPDTTSRRSMVSSSSVKENILSYRKYLALGDILSKGRVVSLDDFARHAAPDTGRFRITQKDATLTPLTQVYVDSFEHDAENLGSGTIAPIGDLYLIEGGCYLKGQDLYNYLYMLDQGVKGIPVQRVWTTKE
jgi:hypothetical protein